MIHEKDGINLFRQCLLSSQSPIVIQGVHGANLVERQVSDHKILSMFVYLFIQLSIYLSAYLKLLFSLLRFHIHFIKECIIQVDKCIDRKLITKISIVQLSKFFL